MEIKRKDIYEMPIMRVIEFALEGVFCQSLGTDGEPLYNGFNEEEDW